MEWAMLGGFRYLELEENLQLSNTMTDLVSGNVINVNDREGADTEEVVAVDEALACLAAADPRNS